MARPPKITPSTPANPNKTHLERINKRFGDQAHADDYTNNTNTIDPRNPNLVFESAAHRIITKLGGACVVAKALGIAPSTVYRWMYPKGIHSGTGGFVPYKYVAILIKYARSQGILITAAEIAGV